MTESLKGIVLETFGPAISPAMTTPCCQLSEKLSKMGRLSPSAPNAKAGTVTLGAYATSSALTKAGAVSGYNMTTEASVAKLYYLFSLGLSRDEIKVKLETRPAGGIDKVTIRIFIITPKKEVFS